MLDKILDQCQSTMHESFKANPKKAALLGDSDESAAAIGISALLAQELLAKRATDHPFTIDKMTSFGRGTGPELQYWYARLCSFLRAESSDLAALSNEDFAPIEEEKYTELLRMLGQYPDITSSAYKTLEPPTVMLYLANVTDQLSICLETEEGQEESSPTPAEAALFESVRQVLENGMNLLGITPAIRQVPSYY
jgi:arginyl-tRNA synthetase